MRYYSRFPPTLWLNLFSTAIWIFLCLANRHRSPWIPFLVLPFASLFLLAIVNQLFTYWQLLPTGLFERRLWHTRTIPFSEITNVHPATLGSRPRPDWLALEFARPAPLSARGTLLLAPKHLDQLLSSLRHAAPQATFEIP